MVNSPCLKCLRCGHENASGSGYCTVCGTRLARVCPSCRLANLPDCAFCSQCGSALEHGRSWGDTGWPTSCELEDPSQGLVGELRLITAMFCDIVDSTELSRTLPPETLAGVVVSYHKTCSQVIEEFGGFVAQHLGDGLLAYFGYPRAHEDDASRAIRSGLVVFEQVEVLNRRLEADSLPRLSMRTAMHTGRVFIENIGTAKHHETLAVGEAINVASRLEAEVPGGSLVVSSATRRLAPNQFVYEPMGSLTPKGLTQSIDIHRVVREVDSTKLDPIERQDAAPRKSRCPLPARAPGRKRELELLLDRWSRAERGRGSTVILEGEAGIGKSHLLGRLRSHLRDSGGLWFEAHCSEEISNNSLQPILDMMRRTLGFKIDDTPDEKLTKLSTALATTDAVLSETVPLFSSLLSLPKPELDLTSHLSPTRRHWKTLEATRTWIRWLSNARPVALCVEDVDWADPSLLELLELLIEDTAKYRVLILLSCRHRPPRWTTSDEVVVLPLEPLPSSAVATILEKVCPGKTFSDDIVMEIARRSDGVPLFIEELARSWVATRYVTERNGVFEYGLETLEPEIPVTLESLLTMRLDELGPAKAFVQVCATLSHRFSYRLIQAVTGRYDADCRAELSTLVQSEILLQDGSVPDCTYRFRHILFRDAARRSIRRSRARQIHAEAALMIEERFAELCESEPAVLALHCAEAGQKLKAVALYSKAARRDLDRSTYAEAVGHIRKGLELVKSLDPTADRTRYEVELLIHHGIAMQALRGYADSRAEAAFLRAQKICETGAGSEQLFPALSGLAAAHLLGGRLRAARDLALRLSEQAGHEENPGQLLWARYSLGLADLYLGDFRGAHEELQSGIALSEALAAGGGTRLYGGHPGVDCRAHGAIALWFLGRTEDALSVSEESIEIARQADDVFSLASARAFRGILHQLRGDVDAAEEEAQLTVSLSTARSFPLWRGLGELVLAWCVARHGKPMTAIVEIQRASSTIASTGTRLGTTYRIALEVDIRIAMGQSAKALTLLDEAEHVALETSERYLAAELLRLRAECLLAAQPAEPAVAAQCLRKSLALARKQGAGALERRAVATLARAELSEGSVPVDAQ